MSEGDGTSRGETLRDMGRIRSEDRDRVISCEGKREGGKGLLLAVGDLAKS